MTAQQFFDKYLGKGIDRDGYFGFQWCSSRPVQSLGFTPSGYSILEIDESSQIHSSEINLYGGVPSTSSSIPPHTTYATTVVSPGATVTYVSGISTDSQISPSIVECVAINMVNYLTRFGMHKIAVKLFNLIIRKPFLNVVFVPHFTHTPSTAKFEKRGVISVIKKHVMNTILFTRDLISFHPLHLNGRQPK